MRLLLDFDAMSSDAGPSGAAYSLLHHAGHRPSVEYLPVGRRAETLQRLSGQALAPVLVTDAGDVISSLREIARWLEGTSSAAVSAPPAVATPPLDSTDSLTRGLR